MGTATILGQTYNTVLMPDGKEWTAENLRYSGGGIGWWWNGAASDDGDGRYYNLEQAEIINDLLTNGWRVPTKVEIELWRDRIFAEMIQALAGGAVKSLAGWNSPNVGANDFYGFGLRGAGYWSAYSGDWWQKGVIGTFGSVGRTDGFWQSPEVRNFDASMGNNSTGGYVGSRYPLRLVRDYPGERLIINGTTLSRYLIDYTPIYEPAFETKTTVSTKVKSVDYGQSYDVYKTRITLAMPVSAYTLFRESLYSISPSSDSNPEYPIEFFSTEQIFVPGYNIREGLCEFVSEQQIGFYDFKMNWCIYELVFAYSVPQIITGDYTQYIQDSFNKSIKTPVDSKSMFSHQANNVVGRRFSQVKHNRFQKYEIDCYQDLVRPSDILQLLNFYRINRSTPFSLIISDSNIFGASATSTVVMSDFTFERQTNGFYQVSYTITQR